jgi:hypothetical protein
MPNPIKAAKTITGFLTIQETRAVEMYTTEPGVQFYVGNPKGFVTDAD